ncbi:MAG: V-type ATPase subunit [Candidatus Micrarchaeaceae archaeon]
MRSGIDAATHYGYSSARVKAMEANLVKDKAMREIMNAKDVGSMVALLFQGDYKEDLESFGGLSIKNELVDFALSRNLARNTGKLVQITPTTERNLIRAIVGKWGLYNIKIAIEAKERKADYDSIARYIIDFGRYNAAAIKDAMREDSVEGMMNKFMINSTYLPILQDGLNAYKKGRSALEAAAAIDRSYYRELGKTIIGLRIIHNEPAQILKMDIDMRNLLVLIKAKRAGLKFSDVSASIISHGRINTAELEQLYNGSKDIESMVSQVKAYDLRNAIEVYKNSKMKQLLIFEIGMKNSIFNESLRLLRHSILSFGAILVYAYLKEIEVFTLRILISSRIYGLSKEEMERLIIWKKE